MTRNFLTTKELQALKEWASDNGLYWEEHDVFQIIDGQFNLCVKVTSNLELFEVFDNSKKGSASLLLEDFNKRKIHLHGIEVPKRKIERFVPEYLKPYLKNFDHFRISQRQDKLWDLLGAVGFHTERLAICDYKLPLKVFGGNFQETYWTLIYTSKKEKKVKYADD